MIFEEKFYLENNNDVKIAVDNGLFLSGLDHFTKFGEKESRDPSAFFDVSFYLENNPDVVSAIDAGNFSSALDHYIKIGSSLGRDPSPNFDTSFYFVNNQDVKLAGVNALEHFLNFGAREGRAPSANYNEQDYLANNPDVAAAVAAGGFSSGVEHFALFGIGENRTVVQASLSGVVADGWISGATVFRDTNNNGVLDAGEASTTTGAQGQFSLDGGGGQPGGVWRYRHFYRSCVQ